MSAGMGFYGIPWDFMGFRGIYRQYLGICLCAAVFIFSAPTSIFAVELILPGQAVQKQAILLDTPTAFRVLAVLEDYPRLKAENTALREVLARQEALDEIRTEREKLYQERIAFLELQAEKWRALNEASLDLAKQTRESQGSWWDRLAHDVGKMTLGGIVGAVIAAALIL